VVAHVMVCITLFRLPGVVDAARARLIAEREAAGPEERENYEEAQPDPDLVAISILTGGLSIFFVPVLFAPAAIVTGVMAASSGHLKGLIGVLLGVLGLGVWIALLVYFVR